MDSLFVQTYANRDSGMTLLEMEAFITFITRFLSGDLDIEKIAEVISSSFPSHTKDMQKILSDLKLSQNIEILNSSPLCMELRLSDIVRDLYCHGYKLLAENLFCCYMECQKNASIMRMNKAQLENRKKISLYFKTIKKLVHEIAFKNPHADVKRLGNIMKQNIDSENDSARKMYLCDKYIALKAAEMDALTNIQGAISPNHVGYCEMESFLSSTSNPLISQVILYGRKADVHSSIGEFDEGENLLRAAYVSADSCVPCVEITDMIYKNVVFKLSQLERTYSDDLCNSLLLEASRGIWSLNEESEEMRIFWKRLFILRMIFCHLGIGKFCDMIKDYIPSQKSLTEAERLLSSSDLIEMEHRRMMFYYVAMSRLQEMKGEIHESLQLIALAKKYAVEGHYVELKGLDEYEKWLKSSKQDTSSSDSDSVSLSRPNVCPSDNEITDVEISFNSLLISECFDSSSTE